MIKNIWFRFCFFVKFVYMELICLLKGKFNNELVKILIIIISLYFFGFEIGNKFCIL